MVFHSCFNNLKGFAISRPPLVVFTLCLTALAIATLSLARLVSQSESLPDPDIRLDWNLLLERMANLDLCILHDESSSINSSVPIVPDTETVTAHLGVAKEVHSTLQNNTLITGAIPAHMLGLRGSHLITVSFRVDVNSSSIHLPSFVCASFMGPASLLPLTQTPPSCEPQHTTAAVNFARLQVRGQGPQMIDDWCNEGTFLRLSYRSNPSLTAMLTLHDRSVVNLHLMHTSYFLLVMAMTLVCYALLKGKPMLKQPAINTIEKPYVFNAVPVTLDP